MSTKGLTAAVVVAASLLLALPALANAAAAKGAAWRLSANAEPSHLNTADASGDIEEFVVRATGGTYRITGQRTGGETAPIPWNATALQFQQAIEAVPAMKAVGNLTVTGGPGDSGGTTPYILTWLAEGASLRPTAEELTNTAEQGEAVEATVTEEFLQGARSKDRYSLTARNTGSQASEGEEVTIHDELPEGVVPTAPPSIEEPVAETVSECTFETTGATMITCSYSEPVPAGGELLVRIPVAIRASIAAGVIHTEPTLMTSGGKSAFSQQDTIVNSAPVAFGIEHFDIEANGLDGEADTQAGDHPYAFTTVFSLNTVLAKQGAEQVYTVPQELRTAAVDLPVGFTGDPLATPRCPQLDLTNGEGTPAVAGGFHTRCPATSIVGTIRPVWQGGSRHVPTFPIYNLVPDQGYPAELGFNAGIGQPIFLYANVIPSPSGYRLQIATPGALRSRLDLEAIAITIFGDPAEKSGGRDSFVTSPSRCSSEPLSARLDVTSWEGGHDEAEAVAYPGITSCNLLQGAAAFSPSIKVTPETTQADTPAGYEVDLRFPQSPGAFGALATPPLKDAVVTLPAGVSLSPAVASGPNALVGCASAQIDLLGTELGEGHPGGNDSPYDDGLAHASPGHCPEASQVGTVQATTPVLEEALHGHIFIAQPNCGGTGQPPCTEAMAEDGDVFGLYLELSGSGIVIKLHGTVEVGGLGHRNGLVVGQIRTRFDETPQFPVEDVKLVLSGGQRSPLANPQTCGAASTTSVLEPWSAPGSGPNATPSASTTTTGCANPLAFAPRLAAGTVDPGAGKFAPLTMTLSRSDGEQDLGGVTLTTPPGVAAILANVPLCNEPDANAGTCPETSKIGSTTVAAGAGTAPLWLSGKVYLTGPYRGAPFGLSIVVPAQAGPYNLGNETVRAAISVDPHTAQVTVRSDPLPQSKDGVPFRLKTVNVRVDRPEFVFNPTNCMAQQVSAAATSVSGTPSPLSSSFAVGGCRGLTFAPKFSAATEGNGTFNRNGASLKVRIATGQGPRSDPSTPTEANIKKVDVALPIQLPSRLTTLQQACTEKQFATNPAGCPAASNVGTAIAHTPVLPVPLAGPAYLVSHGGAAFPDLDIVLQGDGVTIVLAGQTDIKKGVTFSRFDTTPDAPFSSFELNLPEGKFSALAANGNLCKPTKTVTVRKRIAVRRHGRVVHVLRSVKQQAATTLSMPTTITGQNGVVVTQTTKVAVTGCPKAKKHKKAKSGKRHKRSK